MSALDYIKIRGIEGVGEIDPHGRPADLAECFQGISLDVTGGSTAGAGTALATTTEESPDNTLFEQAITSFFDFLSEQSQEISLQQPSEDFERGISRGKGRGLPAILAPTALTLFTALVKWVPQFLVKYTAIITLLPTIIETIKNTIDVVNSVKDLIVGSDVENAFLEFDTLDVFRLFPRSLIKKGLIFEAKNGSESAEDVAILQRGLIDRIKNENDQDADISVIKAIESALQDVALQDIVIKFGDNHALHIKAQLLEY